MVQMPTAPEDCPVATETLAGAGIAVGFPLPIEIAVPLAAGPVKVNCNDTAVPPMTVEDAGVTEAKAGGFTVRLVDWVTPLYVTEMVRLAAAVTACVARLKVPPVEVAVSAIVAGVMVTVGSEHMRDAVPALAPAAPDSANKPCRDWPPVTLPLARFTLSSDAPAGVWMVATADAETVGSATLVAMIATTVVLVMLEGAV